jgi:hypothetical protein
MRDDLSPSPHEEREGRGVHLNHRHIDPVVNHLVLGKMTAAMFVGYSLLGFARSGLLNQLQLHSLA